MLLVATTRPVATLESSMGPKGDFCNSVGCPDVGSLHCADGTITIGTPFGSISVSVTCYQDEEGTGGGPVPGS